MRRYKRLIIILTIMTILVSIFMLVLYFMGRTDNKEISTTTKISEEDVEESTLSPTFNIMSEPTTEPAETNGFDDIDKAIKCYLNTKKIDAVNLSNIEDIEGTVAIMESHMFFPCVYVENLGIAFIYPTQDDDSLPIYLSVNSDTNRYNINVLGAMPGMTFAEIKKKLGVEDIKKSWIATEEIVAYVLEYNDNGFNYSFVSYEEDGKYSELYISLAD